MTESARYGWQSTFDEFRLTPARQIRLALASFVRDASPEQVRAWDDSIPPLQSQVADILEGDGKGDDFSTILEYQLPMESRRPDVLFLVRDSVVVLELKGKMKASQSDVDQASAYARDLRCYHRECSDRPVVPILVPMRARGDLGRQGDVHVVGPDRVEHVVLSLLAGRKGAAVDRASFLSEEAYRPLPTLVEAARELFESRDIRPIWRAKASTDPAVERIASIIHEAAATKTRKLILLTGVPGAGKTLVGLRVVHARFLDDLAVAREGGRPTAAGVFLSGNGPLVEVLQYELRRSGGDGKTFVRGVKDYVERYSRKPGLVPPEHVLVFDEAQRAFDATQVERKHGGKPGFQPGLSEPEHFIEFADRIPSWCVVLGLIGSGQEIHTGEEAGLIQWRNAIARSARSNEWAVHGPGPVMDLFAGSGFESPPDRCLNLDQEIRFHAARDLHVFVQALLDGTPAAKNARRAQALEADGYHLRVTRDLELAKAYLRDRYREASEARFGMVASSKDRDLLRFEIPNDFQSTKRIRYGPWYSDPEDDPAGRSCRHLNSCVTEFGAQGLELNAVLLAWGTDLRIVNGRWSNAQSRGYQSKSSVRDPFQLRINSYRVLLTRARDVCVAFLPPIQDLDETWAYLLESGFRELEAAG